MSEAPQTVRVKRRLDEEPVDALYIEKHQEKRQRRVTDFVFRLVKKEDHHRVGRRAFSREVPRVRTSAAGEEHLEDRHRLPLKEPKEKAPTHSTPPTTAHIPPTEGLECSPTPVQPSRPRRHFHLTTSTTEPVLSRKSASGINKRYNPSRPAIATFVERSAQLSRTRSQTNRTESLSKVLTSYISHASQKEDQPCTPPPAPPPRQKKPLVSATERAWRATTWSKPAAAAMEPTITSIPGFDSPELVAEMQAMVIEEIARAKAANDAAAAAAHQISPQHRNRYPKVPAQRIAHRSTLSHKGPYQGDEVMSDTPPEPHENSTVPVTASARLDAEIAENEEEDGWTYDLYLRQPIAKPLMDLHNTTPSTALPSTPSDPDYGLLVITEETVSEWDNYIIDDDETSEKDYNTEEDDENAEDFYANDYPDDEVDEDDEYGVGAYRFRKKGGASDEEAFDEDDEWDDEVEGVEAWERGRWMGGADRVDGVGE